jgi:arylsulfatase A-like enzyme
MRAMTNAMDTVIGKVLAAVDALDPNTYVIFVGDNGTSMYRGGSHFVDNMYLTTTGRGKGTA